MSTLAGINQQGAQEFREHLPTADAAGRRLWVYPRKPAGRFYRARTHVSWLLLALMFAGPFISIGGNPLLMFNVVERRFSIFGQMFWPTDTYIFAVAMIIFFVMIAVFTAAFGRVWCGWLCPQTILMEMVFRKIEYWIEGNGFEQEQLAKAPWGARKVFKRALKAGIFFALSFAIANWLLMYIIGFGGWYPVVFDNPFNHLGGLTAMLLFTGVFFLIFTRFREQACTFICPYGRFQSVLMDEHSLIVSYDPKRGEKRGHWARGVTPAARGGGGGGHCIDCRMCVSVCPTGIDIRNGLQMECVHCTACIDACDSVMDRMALPRGLIRYASIAGIASNRAYQITSRIRLYGGILMLLGAILVVLLFSRADVQTTMLRTPGALYTIAAGGEVSNLYTLTIRNKTHHRLPISLRVLTPRGATAKLIGADDIGPETVMRAAAIVGVPPGALSGGTCRAVVGLYSGNKLMQKMKTGLLGPPEAYQPADAKVSP